VNLLYRGWHLDNVCLTQLFGKEIPFYRIFLSFFPFVLLKLFPIRMRRYRGTRVPCTLDFLPIISDYSAVRPVLLLLLNYRTDVLNSAARVCRIDFQFHFEHPLPFLSLRRKVSVNSWHTIFSNTAPLFALSVSTSFLQRFEKLFLDGVYVEEEKKWWES